MLYKLKLKLANTTFYGNVTEFHSAALRDFQIFSDL